MADVYNNSNRKELIMGLFKESPYKEATQQIISKINCNYKVFGEDCTEEQVNKVYMEELERGKKKGLSLFLSHVMKLCRMA